ncbi:unnamed protein product [Victoria cruziana]
MENYKEEAEEPTVEKHRGWKAMPYVIGNETFEKLGSTGLLSNLIVFLTTVFNLKQVDAAILLNVFSGTTNLTPVLGAFLSDAYFGRYATLGFACVATFLGMLIVTLTAAIPQLHPPQCGIRPCNLAFGADQFNPNTESGREVSVSWTLGFSIPTAAMFLSCVCFFLGTKIYVKVKPEGSPFTSLAQVFVACIKKRRLKAVSQSDKELFDPPHTSLLNSKLHHTDQFRFLDKAATRTAGDTLNEDGLPSNPWRLCSIQKVEEAKCLVRVIPIWASTIIFNMSVSQQTTYAVLQAMNMDRHVGKHFQIPAVKWITKQDGGFTLLQRMGIGLVLCVISMLVSGIVEARRILAVGDGALLSRNYMSSLLVSVVHKVTGGFHQNWLSDNLNHGRLDYFYYMIAGCGVVNFFYFIFIARWYRYKGAASSSNQVAEIGMKTTNSGASHV